MGSSHSVFADGQGPMELQGRWIKDKKTLSRDWRLAAARAVEDFAAYLAHQINWEHLKVSICMHLYSKRYLSCPVFMLLAKYCILRQHTFALKSRTEHFDKESRCLQDVSLEYLTAVWPSSARCDARRSCWNLCCLVTGKHFHCSRRPGSERTRSKEQGLALWLCRSLRSAWVLELFGSTYRHVAKGSAKTGHNSLSGATEYLGNQKGGFQFGVRKSDRKRLEEASKNISMLSIKDPVAETRSRSHCNCHEMNAANAFLFVLSVIGFGSASIRCRFVSRRAYSLRKGLLWTSFAAKVHEQSERRSFRTSPLAVLASSVGCQYCHSRVNMTYISQSQIGSHTV